MRYLAMPCSLGLFVAACSSATGPSAAASSTLTPAPNVATASPALVTPAATPMSTTVRVEMGDNFFTPDAVTVAVGTTVEWNVGSGEQPHDVIG